MKNLIAFLLVSILMGCGDYRDRYDIHLTEKQKNTPAYACLIPDGIPDTLGNGIKIDWDCNWSRAYVDDRVALKWNDDGTLRALAKGSSKEEATAALNAMLDD